MEWLSAGLQRRLFPLFILFIPLITACPSSSSQQNPFTDSSAVRINGAWSGSLDDAVLGNSSARALLVNERIFLVLDENATELFGSYTQQSDQVHAQLTGYDQHTGLAYLDSELILDTGNNRLDGIMHSEIFAGTSSSGVLALAPAEAPKPEISPTEQSGIWVSDSHIHLGDITITIISDLSLTGYSSAGCLLNGELVEQESDSPVIQMTLDLSSCDGLDGVHQAWMHFYRNGMLKPRMELIWDPGTGRPVYLRFQPW